MVEPARIVAAPVRAGPPAAERRQPEPAARTERPAAAAVADPIRGATEARLAPAATARVPTTPRAPFSADAPVRPGDPGGPPPDLSSTQRFTVPAVPLPVAPPAPVPGPGASVARVPSVRVLSGPSTGRSVPFSKDQLSVGRVGVQVAIVRKSADGYRLIPVEGDLPPRINGAPVPAEGSPLHPGDTFEVAGVRLELAVGS